MKYKSFFKEIKKFKELQDKQKQRGLNDYNLLTTVLKPHDEVRLHSRMIGSLLDPNGLHYQDTLFLEIFLEVLNLDDFELNINNITIGVEYHDIDLYITDGNKHIIIENKIWAKDQPCQIIKYINIIKEEHSLKTDNSIPPKIEDMRVIYLTPRNKNIPDEHQLDKDNYISFSGTDAKLVDCSKRDGTLKLVPNGLINFKVPFTRISYQKEILNWIVKCNDEVKNITNLNEAIKQYMNVIKIVINKHESNIKPLYEYLLGNKHLFKSSQDFYNNNRRVMLQSDIEIEIHRGYEKAREKLTENFFAIGLEYFFITVLNGNYTIKSEINTEEYKYKITIQNKEKNETIIFASENYSTTKDYYIKYNVKKVTKYRYRYDNKSINDFYDEDGEKAKEYYLSIINDPI